MAAISTMNKEILKATYAFLPNVFFFFVCFLPGEIIPFRFIVSSPLVQCLVQEQLRNLTRYNRLELFVLILILVTHVQFN